ncbi:hypothetical protein IT402_00200 [Candidatus Nomurabacteria bacterium]|nr:hypothetical protein [Candidatus Nomurabacteria bacterium]
MTQFIKEHYLWFFLSFLAIVVGLSFYLGYQEGRENTISNKDKDIVFSCPNTILEKQKISFIPENTQLLLQAGDSLNTPAISPGEEGNTEEVKGMFVGSKNGTKYYTPGCSGTNRIKPENYIWFQSVEDANLQGYSKGSC